MTFNTQTSTRCSNQWQPLIRGAWLQKRLGSGPERTYLCDISKFIYTSVFLFLLPGNQEAGPEIPLGGRRSDGRNKEEMEGGGRHDLHGISAGLTGEPSGPDYEPATGGVWGDMVCEVDWSDGGVLVWSGGLEQRGGGMSVVRSP